ncbi:hypothetical protein K438DRAFT_1991115 [Mycena galopus ATCC 62051]|nr:hypothetical protein K438DRAFT_1991115 [Mycena galopus ATCC 62051]
MEAPLSHQWFIPDNVPLAQRLAWLETESPQPPKPREAPQVIPVQPDEREPAPPIPAHLHGRECLYGYTITDELMEAYRAVHTPHEHPPNDFLLLAHNHTTIYDLAAHLGLRVSIDHLDGHDDILWFSYTRGGVVQVKQVPIASRLERFAEALGITEKARWHDAWVAAVQVIKLARTIRAGEMKRSNGAREGPDSRRSLYHTIPLRVTLIPRVITKLNIGLTCLIPT